MAKFLVTNSTPTNGRPVVKGLVLQADSGALAKEICASLKDDPTWNSSATTATDISTGAFGDGLAGYIYRVQVERKAGDLQDGPLVDVSVTGGSSWGLDEMGTALAVALNARPQIAGATWTLGDPGGSNNILKVAETTDNLGDRAVQVRVYLPGGKHPIASMVGTIVDSGLINAALTVALTYSTSNYPQIGHVL